MLSGHRINYTTLTDATGDYGFATFESIAGSCEGAASSGSSKISKGLRSDSAKRGSDLRQSQQTQAAKHNHLSKIVGSIKDHAS